MVALYTMDSQSVSHTAEFELRRGDGRPVLLYIYDNKPSPTAINAMEPHEGTAALTYFEDKRLLDGSYYTGRSRQSYGKIMFSFKEKRLQGRYF